MSKQKTSVSLSEDGKKLLGMIAELLGISKSDVLEVIIREKAEQKGISLESLQDRTRPE
jgi:replication initiation and membrane attachment protein DnaB